MNIWQKLWAILRQRCPGCYRGRVFRTSTEMHKTCPECGLLFEREEGYFLGAMYISYGMATAILLVFMYAGHLIWPDVELSWMVLIAGALFIPFVPMVFRYSRVLWIAFERWAWP